MNAELAAAKTYEAARAILIDVGSICTREDAAEFVAAGGMIHASENGKLVSLNGRVWAVAKNKTEIEMMRAAMRVQA